MNNDYLEELRSKRQAEAIKSEKEEDKKESLAALKNVSGEVARQASRSRSTTQPVKLQNDDYAKSEEIREVANQIAQLNVTTFLASKDSWAEIVENMATSAERIRNVLSTLDGGVIKIDESFTKAVDNLQSVVEKVKTVKVESDKDVSKQVVKLTKAVEALNVQPIVNVPEPVVNVDVPKIDTKPLEKVFQEFLDAPKEEALMLSNFIGQDIDNDADVMQYVGMLNPNGDWYIIENTYEPSQLRYVFGRGKYKKAWENHVNLDYRRIDEAYNAIRS